jgi:hypothetical protein
MPDGRFVFSLAPGTHTLRIDVPPARTPGSGSTSVVEYGDGKIAFELQTGGPPIIPAPSTQPTLVAETTVVVGKNLDDIALALHRGGRIGGRFEFDGARPAVEDLKVSYVSVISRDAQDLGLIAPARIEPDGPFVTAGLPDGAYELSWTIPGRWFVTQMKGPGDAPRGVVEVEHDTTTHVLLNLTSMAPKLEGYVRGRDGFGLSDAFIYVFPTDPAARFRVSKSFLRSGEFRPTRDGHYEIDGLVPGDYFVAACNVPVSDWESPDATAALERVARRIHVEGEQTLLDLVVTQSPLPEQH